MKGAATGSPVAVAQSIAVAAVLNLDGPAGATSTPRLSVVSPPPEGASSPELVPSDRVASLPSSRLRQRFIRVFRHVFRQAMWPVSPFVDALVPSTTCSTHTSRHCLAADTRGAPAPFYLGHSPSLRRLKHRRLSLPAPGTTPVAKDLPALATIVPHLVTLVRGCCPSRVDARCTSELPHRRSFLRGRGASKISGGRNQRLPHTHSAATLTSSAPSPNAVTSKPFQASHG